MLRPKRRQRRQRYTRPAPHWFTLGSLRSFGTRLWHPPPPAKEEHYAWFSECQYNSASNAHIPSRSEVQCPARRCCCGQASPSGASTAHHTTSAYVFCSSPDTTLRNISSTSRGTSRTCMWIIRCMFLANFSQVLSRMGTALSPALQRLGRLGSPCCESVHSRLIPRSLSLPRPLGTAQRLPGPSITRRIRLCQSHIFRARGLDAAQHRRPTARPNPAHSKWPTAPRKNATCVLASFLPHPCLPALQNSPTSFPRFPISPSRVFSMLFWPRSMMPSAPHLPAS